MSVTSGFFNSLNGDRKYNAEQMSAIFDGIINDGVFANIGTAFGVTANGTDTEITVGIGRAWFNSAWIYNDAILSLQPEDSEMVLNRYDAVVIEVDHSDSGRKGDIKIIKGTPSSTPVYPTMTRNAYVNQYPLAYIYRAAGSTVINQANVTNRIGTTDCPYITAILQVTNIDNIVAQWQGEWDVWSAQWTQWEALWNNWFAEQTEDVDDATSAWLSQMQTEFEVWFNSLQVMLDGDVATNLAGEIADLQERFRTLAEESAVYEEMQDSTGDDILDSNGNPIEGRTIMGSGNAGGTNVDDISPDDIGAAKAVHAAQHAENGIDPITPAMIGAYSKAESDALFTSSTDVANAMPKLHVVTLTTSGWSSKSQNVTVNGVSANETSQKITVAPSAASRAVYTDCLVQCTAQAANRLTFTCDEVPGSNLTVYVTVEEVLSASSS